MKKHIFIIFIVIASSLSSNVKGQVLYDKKEDSIAVLKTFTNINLQNVDNKSINNDLKNKVVLYKFISFDFDEFNELNEIYNFYKHNNDFKIICIAFEDIETVKKYCKKNNTEYKIVSIENNKNIFQWQESWFMLYIITNKKGEIIYQGIPPVVEVNNEEQTFIMNNMVQEKTKYIEKIKQIINNEIELKD